eukprot:Rmarinus@m.20677
MSTSPRGSMTDLSCACPPGPSGQLAKLLTYGSPRSKSPVSKSPRSPAVSAEKKESDESDVETIASGTARPSTIDLGNAINPAHLASLMGDGAGSSSSSRRNSHRTHTQTHGMLELLTPENPDSDDGWSRDHSAFQKPRRSVPDIRSIRKSQVESGCSCRELAGEIRRLRSANTRMERKLTDVYDVLNQLLVSNAAAKTDNGRGVAESDSDGDDVARAKRPR